MRFPPHWPSRCFLLFLFYLLAPALSFAQPEPDLRPALLPVPAQVTWGEDHYQLRKGFKIQFENEQAPAVRAAADRLVARLEQKTDVGHDEVGLTIRYDRVGKVQLGEDESYQLQVTDDGATLTAPTSLGVLRGLATLEQLPVKGRRGYYLPAVDITDQPRFPWRGLLIDVARHFQPVAVIKRNLDGMAAVKLNVFHWHLSDDQGFRVESKLFPRLQTVAANGQYYTQAQVREVVQYAAERGIRVVPEFDVPGHTTALIAAYPRLASNDSAYAVPTRWGVLNIALDPTRETTYQLLDSLFSEMIPLFPDPYFHIGGDENDGRQWRRNPRIASFMKTRKMVKANGQVDSHALQTYFNRRILPMLTSRGKMMVGWDEILGADLPAEAVIQSWRGRKGLYDAVKSGHQALLSNGYYVDLNYSAASHYLNDPLPADAPLTTEQKQRILGGEATMWAEFADSVILDSRIWPRTAAIAERLWSPVTVQDVPDMYRRLAVTSVALEALGLQHRRAPAQLLARLAGPNDGAPLQVLASVLEPVKEYKRHFQGFQYTTQTPLTRLVDAAQPEAEAARQFEVAVAALVQRVVSPPKGKLAGDAAARAALLAVQAPLIQWQANEARLKPLLATEPALREYAPLSAQLSTIARLGLERLRLLEKGEAPSATWQAAALKQLTAAHVPAGQAQLAVVTGIRKLVELK